jgi:fibro-slime domain-containing protein
MYGTPHNANATNGHINNGEAGLVGNVCNTTNDFANCGVLNTTDRTPIYQYTGTSPLGSIQSPASFYTWFHSSDVNVEASYNLTMNLVSGSSREYTFSETYFFPLDGQGWQDHAIAQDGHVHNFAYCLQIHGRFAYEGGETFWFQGDDDVWVYLDNRLMIDLGGPHTDISASISLDTIGFTVGNNYRFDFFYCERHTIASEMELTTSIAIQCTYYDWCDVCDGNGQSCCTAADIAACNDSNACTTDSCAVLVPPNVGCQNVNITCDDGNACTTDTCNPATGCVFTAISCSTY